MRKVSVLIGEVIDGNPKEYFKVNDETFKAIHVAFLDAKIDVVISEYVAEASYNGKVRVTGYLASYVEKGKKPVFYFYANTIEEAEADADITNEVNFFYTVTKVNPAKVNSRGVDILPLVVSDYTSLQTTSVLYVCIRGKDARRLKTRPKGYTIEGKGYLKQYRDIYEVITTSVVVDGEDVATDM